MSKIWAILGGGDWYDASVDHVVVPDGVDVDAEAKKMAAEREYVYSLSHWLIEHCGARRPTEDELEEYRE